MTTCYLQCDAFRRFCLFSPFGTQFSAAGGEERVRERGEKVGIVYILLHFFQVSYHTYSDR